MYEVKIDAVMDGLIDYDKNVGNQNKGIKEKISKLLDNELTKEDAINFGYDDIDLGKLKSSLLSENRSVESFLGDFSAIRGSKNAGEKLLNKYGIKGIRYLDNSARNTFGGEILSIDKTSDGFKGKVVLDDPNRQTGLGGSGRTITTSKTYKTEKEAKEWADKAIGKATNNYVIFDDKIIDIMKKYGIVGAVGVTALQGRGNQSPEVDSSL